MAGRRVMEIRRILLAASPYRVSDREIRRVLAHVPNPRARYRASLNAALAAIIALPYRIEAT